MHYHVRITQKSLKWRKDETKLDLSLKELQQRVLEPYAMGQPITLGGKAIVAGDIERVRIGATKQDSGTLRAVARQRQGEAGIIPPIPVEWYIADMAEDVTDDFIIGPPGCEAGIITQSTLEPKPPTGAPEVFVPHGRNEDARYALFTFLRSIGLKPLEWNVAVQATGKPAPYIGEVLNVAFSLAHAIVVLFTPDDEVRLKAPFQIDSDPLYEIELTGQARPNVLFEAGMAMGRAEDRTVLVEPGELRPFSDLAGRHMIRIDNTTQRRQELAQRLQAAGCPVKLDGTDWHGAGDFQAVLDQLVQGSSGSTDVEEQQPSTSEFPQLSEDAKELLLEAKEGSNRIIVVIRTNTGGVVITNGKQFAEMGDGRSLAKWLAAIEELRTHQLVEPYKGRGEAYEINHKGFQVADALAEK